MGRIEEEVAEVAAQQRFMVSRGDVLAAGGSDNAIRWRLEKGVWRRVQEGVYQTDRRGQDWRSKLMAAVLAAGEGSLASHRAALVLWGMDGISSAPVEITVPYTHGPIPRGTIVHRTRRPVEAEVLDGVPVTTPERTLLDCAALLPRLIVTKALESALRKRLTSVTELYEVLSTKGGRGVRGTRKLRSVLAERVADTPTDSGSETEILFHMRRARLPEPELQHELFSLEGERMLPDFYWPAIAKAIEIDGLDAHASADALDHDLKRQNALLDLGIELRRFSARAVRRNPDAVVAEIRRFLES